MIRMADMSFNKPDRSIDYWLFFVMFLVVAMIVIGGATRLTNSGLSITEWAPIKGAMAISSTTGEYQRRATRLSKDLA